jgi:hypothetical protein
MFVLSGLLPLSSDIVSAGYQGWFIEDLVDTETLQNWDQTDVWDFNEVQGSYVAVGMRPNTDYDLNIRQNTGGAGGVLVQSIQAGTNPDICIHNGIGIGGANSRSAEVFNPGGGSPWGNTFRIEYNVANTVNANSVQTFNFNNANILETYQIAATSGVTYTFRFWSVPNAGADYRFYVFNLASGNWGNLNNALGTGSYQFGVYTSFSVTPLVNTNYAVVVVNANMVSTNNVQFVIGAPDLVANSLTVSPAPVTCGSYTVLPQNRPYTYSVTAYNQGYGDAGPFTVTTYDNGVQHATWNIAFLGARSTSTSYPSYPTANADTHYMSAAMDTAMTVPEDGTSGTWFAENNNGNGRTDSVAEVRPAWTNDADDTVPSGTGYPYYFYGYYLSAGESQKFSLWNPAANTDFDMFLYSPSGTLVATAASTGYPERFAYSTTTGGYHYILVQRISGAGSTFTFSVDNADPTINVFQPADGASLRGNYELRLNCRDWGSGITDSALNPVYRVDGGNWVDMTSFAGVGYNFVATLATGALYDGGHSLEFMVWDNAANYDYDSRTIVTDNTNPSACSLVYPVASQFVEGALVLKATASDAVGLSRVDLSFGGALAGLGTQQAGYDSATGYWQYTLDTKAYSDGTASVSLTARDRAGNSLSQASTSFTIDNAAPVLGFNSPAGGAVVAGNAVTVSATASDAAGTVAVRYKIDSGAWYSLSLAGGVFSAAWDCSAYPDGAHTITVRATDGAGHITEQSASVTVDNTAPVCSLVSPLPGQYVEGRHVFKVQASDQNGIRSVSLAVAGAGTFPMAYNSQTGLFERELDTTLWADAAYQLAATVTDAAASAGIRPAVTLNLAAPGFHIDNVAPTLVLVSPANQAMVEGAVTLSVTSADAPTAPAVSYSIDGVAWVSLVSAPGNLWTASWASAGVPDGLHTVKFRADGQLGHRSSLDITVTVDNSRPVCALSSPSADRYIEGRFLFQVAASDAVGVASVELNISNSSAWVRQAMDLDPKTGYYSLEVDTAAFSDGAYFAQAAVMDGIGHLVVSAPARFFIDNNAPAFTVASPDISGGPYLKGTVTVAVQPLDTLFLDRTEYRVDGGPPVRMTGYSAAWDTTAAADGPHTLRISQSDLIGHVTTVTLEVVVDNTAPALYWGAPDQASFLSGVYTVRVKAVDAVGIASVAMQALGRTYPMTLNTGTGYYEYPLDTTALPDNDTILTVTAVEVSGLNPDAVSVRAVRIDNNAPALSVSSPAQGEIVQGLYSFDLLASDAYLDRTEFRVDSLGWAPVAGGWDTARHPDGVHMLAVRASDLVGRLTEMTLSVTIDNSVPVCAFASPGNQSFVSKTVLIQVRAFDPAGLTSVVLEGTGAQMLAYNQDSGMYESALDTTLLRDGTYRYTARSTDLAGRMTESAVWLRSDNTAPALSVSSPEDGDHLTGVMAVAAEAPDAFPAVIEYQVDSLGWRALNATLDTALLSDGPHSLAVRATDGSGKVSEARLIIRTDNTPPVLSILEPPASGAAIAGTLTLRAAVSEPDTVADVSYSLDGGRPLPLLMNRATGYYEQDIPTGVLDDNSGHNISVNVTSRAGLSTTLSRPFRVDNTPPEVKVRSPANAAQKGTVVISVDISDQSGLSEVEVRLDGGAWRDMSVTRTPGRYEYRWATGVAQNGEHSFEVRTRDGLGNRGTNVHMFRVDNPDYGPLILAVIIILAVVGAVLIVARGRKKRAEELLPPVEEPPGPAKPSRPEEFPEATPVAGNGPGEAGPGAPRAGGQGPAKMPVPEAEPFDGLLSLKDRAGEGELKAEDTRTK